MFSIRCQANKHSLSVYSNSAQASIGSLFILCGHCYNNNNSDNMNENVVNSFSEHVMVSNTILVISNAHCIVFRFITVMKFMSNRWMQRANQAAAATAHHVH